ncbi:hypothetical protein [Clostridium sp. C8-1-8]|uniref:hypothetical protein n=1 Tax=Clostridium sp. C8-1-8 TaxID=2698831 RepID=UPI0013699D85|nr:hypothetical protein [Clostridium sp. C8-1-8]
MGLESYRIGVKFKNFHSINEIVDRLKDLGGSVINLEDNRDVSMEFIYTIGIIEILVSTVKDQNKILFELIGKQSDKLVNKTNDIGNVILNIRFAKPNSVMIVKRIIELLKEINTQFELKSVSDIEAKCQVDLDNFLDFEERVNIAKQDFEKYFHFIPYPVRCSEVFKK